MFLLVLNPPPPILRLNIAHYAVAEGWLLLDIRWFVLLFEEIIFFRWQTYDFYFIIPIQVPENCSRVECNRIIWVLMCYYVINAQ